MMKRIIILFALVFSYTLSFGQAGNCLQFDGTNDYVALPASNSILSGTSFTLEAWIKTGAKSGTGTSHARIITLCNTSNSSYGSAATLILEDDSIIFAFNDGSSFRRVSSLQSSYYNNNWHHLAATHNGTNFVLYLNGNIINSGSRSISGSQFNTDPAVIGGRVIDRFFAGQIDEVRIWNVARSQTEIQANMYKEIGTHTNLKAYYKLNESETTSTAADASGNTNTGTLTNFGTLTPSPWKTSTAPLPYQSVANTSWTTASTWDAGQGVPTNAWSIINISNTVSVDDYTIGDLGQVTIDASGSLTINADKTLTIKSTATGTGSLVNLGTLTFGSGAKSVVERWVEGSTNGMNHFVSPPISNATGGNLWGSTVGSSLKPWKWDEPIDDWVAVYTGDALTAGVGYSVPYKENKTLVFTGTLNDGPITVNITRRASGNTNSDPGFNLIGNPYPSRLNATSFVDDLDNTDITGTLHFWADDKSGNPSSNYSQADYTTWTKTGTVDATGGGTSTVLNGYIELGQGFLIRRTAAGSSSVSFKNSHRANNNAATFFIPEISATQRIWLSLLNTDEFLYNEILLA